MHSFCGRMSRPPFKTNHRKSIVLFYNFFLTFIIFLIFQFDLCVSSDPMSYGIGVKELWIVDKSKHKPGYVEHTLGYPLVYFTLTLKLIFLKILVFS